MNDDRRKAEQLLDLWRLKDGRDGASGGTGGALDAALAHIEQADLSLAAKRELLADATARVEARHALEQTHE